MGEPPLVSLNQRPLSSAFLHQALLLPPIHSNLSDPLKAMGMSQVFDPARAELEGISDRKPLYLMGLMQSDFVEVNEKGTEAAGVTMMEGSAGLNPPPPPPPFEMIVNRPFVFAICDDLSGAVVFLAAVADPLA